MNANVVLKKISKIYDINNVESQKTVLRNINLELKESKVYGLIGSNGSGKSTLLKIISQIIPETSGSLKVKGLAEYLSLDFIMGQMNSSITALVDGEIMVFERILTLPFFAAISFNLLTNLESISVQDTGLLL